MISILNAVNTKTSVVFKVCRMEKKVEKIIKFPYGINSVYGLSRWLKDYGYYPKSFPLFVYMDHGMSLYDRIHPHEINNDAPLIFKFSPRLVEAYKRQSKKPVYSVLNPTIHYRESQGVTQSANAAGTLFFAAHSTHDLDDHTNWMGVIDKIKTLPQAFHPVDVCLHSVDVAKGTGRYFEENGFRIYCAGDQFSDDFVKGFYDILKNYKYAVSNLIGSYAFYAVEMGIPFSYYGDEPVFINKSDTNFAVGETLSYLGQEAYQKAKALFTGLHTSITKEQEHFVNFELGKYSTVSRKMASFLLYKAYLSYSFKNPQYLKYMKRLIHDILEERYMGFYKTLKRYHGVNKTGNTVNNR